MSISPEHVIDPKSLMLKAMAEGEGVVIEDPPAEKPDAAAGDDPNKGKAAPAKPALEPGADDDADDDQDGSADIESVLDGLSKRLDAVMDRKVERAREAGDRRPEKTLREEIESEDESVLRLVGAIEQLTDKVAGLEKRQTDSEADRQAQRAQAFEKAYSENVAAFGQTHPGFTDKELAGIGDYHVRLYKADPRLSALSYEEVARRMYGEDGLAARRSKGTEGDPGAPKPRNGARPSLPSGAPIPSRSTGSGPPKKFEPGPGKGVGDVTEQLRRAGAFAGVIQER